MLPNQYYRLGQASREARLFQKVRRDLKLTQTEMAELLQVSQMLISFIERGRRKVTRKQAIALRNLAFHRNLPYAVSVFDEYDTEETYCPQCEALQHHRHKRAMANSPTTPVIMLK